MPSTLSYKTLPLELADFKTDDGLMQFSGYAAHFSNVDHGLDVILPGAFDETLKKRSKRPLLYQHDLSSPIGVEMSLVTDDKGLFGTWQLARTTLGMDVYELLKLKAIGAMSVGYITEEADYDGDVRLLKRIDLLENSVVTLGMNEQAVITGVKADQPFDQLLKQLSVQLNLGVSEAKALAARRRDDERELSERHITAITAYLVLAEAAAVDLKALLPAPEAKAEETAAPAEAPEPSAPSAISLRLAAARRRLERTGILERTA